MVLVDATSFEEQIHFILIDFSITILVDWVELIPELALFLLLDYRKFLLVHLSQKFKLL